MNRLSLFPNPTKASVKQVVEGLASELSKMGFELYMDKDSPCVPDNSDLIRLVSEKEAIERSECMLVIGGDGTILYPASKAAEAKKPVVGINFGNLGYLSEIEINEIRALEALKNDKYILDERMMLNAEIFNEEGQLVYSQNLLNEAALLRAILTRTIDITVEVNGRKTISFSADGVIISTPTGSTAYSLSAGGPILEPSCKCMIVTPVCPHALNIRSFVLPDSHVITVSVNAKETQAILSGDGFPPVFLKDGDRISVKKSELSLSLVRIKGLVFYEKMCEKLSKEIKRR